MAFITQMQIWEMVHKPTIPISSATAGMCIMKITRVRVILSPIIPTDKTPQAVCTVVNSDHTTSAHSVLCLWPGGRKSLTKSCDSIY